MAHPTIGQVVTASHKSRPQGAFLVARPIEVEIVTHFLRDLIVSFSDGNGTGAGALFFKKLKKKLLAHGTLLHFR